MSSRTLAKTKNQNSTTFSPVFGKKLSDRTFTPESANEIRDVSSPNFAHNFGDIQVESPSFKQSCPLALSGPAHCPFGGICHTCPPRMQTKLTINEPGDKYEQEADRVANQVMRKSDADPKRKPSLSLADRSIQPPCVECIDESIEAGEPSKHKALISSDFETLVNSLRSSGKPLEVSERVFMESRFGHSFSDVRIHSGQEATLLTNKIGAKAFTLGNHIFMGSSKLWPYQTHEPHLLAHELAHVVQQTSTPNGLMKNRDNGVIQCYGHAHSCTYLEHLKDFIWPGHDHAKKALDRAIYETDRDPIHPKVEEALKMYFGHESTTKTNLHRLHRNFVRIRSALDEEYLYHCTNKHKPGEYAETSRSGAKDITFFFGSLAGWTVPAAAWLIIHENVHRSLGFFKLHPWRPIGGYDGCSDTKGRFSKTKFVDNNPDSYACFASLMWFLQTV